MKKRKIGLASLSPLCIFISMPIYLMWDPKFSKETLPTVEGLRA